MSVKNELDNFFEKFLAAYQKQRMDYLNVPGEKM